MKDINKGKYNAVYYLGSNNNYAELLQSLSPEAYLGNLTSTYFNSNALKQLYI